MQRGCSSQDGTTAFQPGWLLVICPKQTKQNKNPKNSASWACTQMQVLIINLINTPILSFHLYANKQIPISSHD